MATEIGIGFSNNPDTVTASQEATKQARAQIRRSRLDFALLFATGHYDTAAALPVIRKILDQTKLIGTSTAGILIADRTELTGLAVVAFSSDEIKFETGCVNYLNLQNMHDGGISLANGCVTDFGNLQRKFFLFFSDSLLNDTVGLVNGIKKKMGNTLPVIGAGSLDDFQFKKAQQFHQDTSYTNSAVGVIFGGRLETGMSCRHGWKPLGKPRRIDRAEGHVIKRIDGKPAARIYQEFFGEKDTLSLKESPLGLINIRYPLGIYVEGQEEFVLRNVTRVTDDGDLVCQDTMEEGAQVHILIGNQESCLSAAEQAAQDVKEQLKGEAPKFVLLISSIGRYRMLGRLAPAEIRVVKRVLGDHIPMVGIYACGEIFSYAVSPLSTKTVMQNGSIIILAVR